MSRSIRRLAGSLLRKPNTHSHCILRKILILISTGSGWGARRLDIGLNLHHQALLLLCVCKCEKRRLRGNAFNNICMLLRCSHMQLVRFYKYGSDHHCKSLCRAVGIGGHGGPCPPIICTNMPPLQKKKKKKKLKKKLCVPPPPQKFMCAPPPPICNCFLRACYACS